MLTFLLHRLLQAIPTFLLITVAVFVLVRLLPGDPTSALLGDKATDEMVARANAELGLDRPVPVQFAFFLDRLLHADLGTSIVLKVPVSRLVVERMPVTLALAGYAGVLAILLALPLAFIAALSHGRPTDLVIRGLFQVGLSTPVFYLGLVLLTVLAAQLRWFPVGGFGAGVGENLHHLFLPALTLALSLSAVLMRSLRGALLEALTADYVDFARAKGLATRIVLGRHVLRNALVPTVTLFGLNIGTLIGGSVVTETVFAVPGVGRLMVESIFGRDYPVIQGLTLTFALLVSLTFIATDLIQARLDPRIAR